MLNIFTFSHLQHFNFCANYEPVKYNSLKMIVTS